MFPKPTYKTGGTNLRKSKPSKNDRAMVSGVSSILRKIKDKKNRKEVAGDMVKQFNREGVNYNKEKFLKNSRSFALGGPVKPYYTSNRNDPRFKKYTDSLDAYNRGEADYARLKNIQSKVNKINKDKYFWENDVVVDTQTRDLVKEKEKIKGYHGLNPISSTTSYSRYSNEGLFPKLREDYLRVTGEGKDKNVYFYETAERYKKPVQPVIYKPAPKKNIMTTMSKPSNKKATTTSTTSTTSAIPKTTINTEKTGSSTSFIPKTTTSPVIPTVTTNTTPTVQTNKQLPGNTPQMQRYNYMSTEDKKRAVKKYGDSSKVPFQGVDINQLRREVPTFQRGGSLNKKSQKAKLSQLYKTFKLRK